MLRFLILFGTILTVAALLWPVLEGAGFGDLPGDVVLDFRDFRLYLPLGIAAGLSLLLTVIFRLLGR